MEEELTQLEKKLRLEKMDEWSRTKIKKDWALAAKESRLAIMAKYGQSKEAHVPAEPEKVVE